MKSGMTMMSIVLYVMLFFIFTVFAISFGTNMNIGAMSQKGQIYINEQFDKLQYNLIKSAKSSNDVNIMTDNTTNITIVFSNNDTYKFNLQKKQITKNDAILIRNVENFEIIDHSKLDIIEDNTINIEQEKKFIAMELTLKKYDSQKLEQLFVTVGGKI